MTDTRAVPNLLLTTEELAKVLRCSVARAKQLLRDGSIASIKIGGLRRIRLSDLMAYVERLEPSVPGAGAPSNWPLATTWSRTPPEATDPTTASVALAAT